MEIFTSGFHTQLRMLLTSPIYVYLSFYHQQTAALLASWSRKSPKPAIMSQLAVYTESGVCDSPFLVQFG